MGASASHSEVHAISAHIKQHASSGSPTASNGNSVNSTRKVGPAPPPAKLSSISEIAAHTSNVNNVSFQGENFDAADLALNVGVKAPSTHNENHGNSSITIVDDYKSDDKNLSSDEKTNYDGGLNKSSKKGRQRGGVGERRSGTSLEVWGTLRSLAGRSNNYDSFIRKDGRAVMVYRDLGSDNWQYIDWKKQV